MKIWGTFPFLSPEFSWNLKLKTCHLLHFMHWHVHKSVCRSNVLTGVKWLPRDFRWHALTSMQNRASQLSMYWGQCGPQWTESRVGCVGEKRVYMPSFNPQNVQDVTITTRGIWLFWFGCRGGSYEGWSGRST